jgi:hypothetical protein
VYRLPAGPLPRVTGLQERIVRGEPDVQRLFAITRLEDRLPFFDDLDEAIAAA